MVAYGYAAGLPKWHSWEHLILCVKRTYTCIFEICLLEATVGSEIKIDSWQSKCFKVHRGIDEVSTFQIYLIYKDITGSLADLWITRVADLFVGWANLWIPRFGGVADLLAGQANLWIPHFTKVADLLACRANLSDFIHKMAELSVLASTYSFLYVGSVWSSMQIIHRLLLWMLS